MIKKLFCIFAWLLCCVDFLFCQSVQQYDNQMIKKVEVTVMNLLEGSCFDKNSVLSRMKTRENSLFSQVEFDNDLKTLVQDFDRIEPHVEFVEGGVFLFLKVWPKPKIRVITWCGNERIKTEPLQKELGICAHTLFDRKAFNQAFHKLKLYYVKKGFFEAELSYDVRLDEVTNEVDIEVEIKEGRSGNIKDIVFHNFTSHEESEIAELMVTKRWSIFTSWLNNDGTYNEEAVQHDRLAILNYLQNEGYADAAVNIEVCEADSSNRIIVHITACKGELYSIGKVSFSGNCVFNDEQIRNCIEIEEGDPYSPEELRNTINAIASLYGNRGYIDAYVDYEPRLSADSCSYSIHFVIEEGEQFRVGLIKVFGNSRTQASTILHEVLFAPGEVFSLNKLQKTEEKLRNIGYFSCVNIYAVKSDSFEDECEGNFRDVHIEVEETDTGSFNLFFGYSTNENLFGGLRLTEKNFNYKGLPAIWREGFRAIRGAGEYAHATMTIGARSRSFVVSWTKPFFMDTKWSVGFDIEKSSNRYISRDYDIEAWAFGLSANYPIHQFLRFGWHYRLRDSHVIVKEDHPSKQLTRQAHNGGLISATGVSLVYDSRNNPSKPTAGLLSRAQIEYAGLGGKHTFFGYGYLNSLYFPLGKKNVMKYRADARFLQPIGNTTAFSLPIDERLFLGGDDMVRGYRPYAIGPKFPEGDPMGGISLLQLSAEISREMSKRIDLFVFVDAGSLSIRKWAVDELKVAIGYGMRFKIFEAGPPLTIGMGYPLNAHNRSDVKRFFFTLGARF